MIITEKTIPKIGNPNIFSEKVSVIAKTEIRVIFSINGIARTLPSFLPLFGKV